MSEKEGQNGRAKKKRQYGEEYAKRQTKLGQYKINSICFKNKHSFWKFHFKKSRTDSSVLDVLIMKDQVNKTITDTAKKR